MKTNLSRRKFIIFGLTGSGLAASGLWLRFAENRDQEFIIRILQQYFPTVTSAMEKSIMADFAKDLAQQNEASLLHVLSAQFQTMYFSAFIRKYIPALVQRKIDQFDRMVISEFVLSTNCEEYFQNKRIELLYRGLPEVVVCSPFSRKRDLT